MRVIAGRLGGRRLQAPSSSVTRPTGDRVRESVFATLGDINGAVVLDLFAGSGAMAIEALSRGASRAVLVERDRNAAKVIEANLEALELADPEAVLIRGNALRALEIASKSGETYDLVFLDPPYRQPAMLGADPAKLIGTILAPAARVVTESDRRQPLEIELPLIDERRYGDTVIRIHQQ
ncbi:MAG: 16S rRNA (guanine(966)-N(2))-methyltransferase RsmD [Actinomycetes bacterium]|jgi:16S rRNA (guanine966-N2)-methyltransferase